VRPPVAVATPWEALRAQQRLGLRERTRALGVVPDLRLSLVAQTVRAEGAPGAPRRAEVRPAPQVAAGVPESGEDHPQAGRKLQSEAALESQSAWADPTAALRVLEEPARTAVAPRALVVPWPVERQGSVATSRLGVVAPLAAWSVVVGSSVAAAHPEGALAKAAQPAGPARVARSSWIRLGPGSCAARRPARRAHRCAVSASLTPGATTTSARAQSLAWSATTRLTVRARAAATRTIPR
jgi:hypothetical protein